MTKKIKKIYLLLILFVSTYPISSFAQLPQICPAATMRWGHYPQVGATNATLENTYTTPLEVFTNWFKKLREDNPRSTYVWHENKDDQIAVGIMNYDLYYDGTFVRREQDHAMQSPVCGHGFEKNIPNYLQCKNITTKSCSCPEGEHYKPSASKCVRIRSAPPDANPLTDNGPDCQSSPGEPSQPKCGNPINPNSGNKIQYEVDFDLEGIASWLSLSRTYNSSPNLRRTPDSTYMFGASWSSNFDTKFHYNSTSLKNFCFIWLDDFVRNCQNIVDSYPSVAQAFSLTKADGGVINFSSFDENGDAFSIGPGQINKLRRTYKNGLPILHLTTFDRTVYEIVPRGYWWNIVSVTKNSGQSLKFTYLSYTSNDSKISRFPEGSPICKNVQAEERFYVERIGCITDDWGRQVNLEYQTIPGPDGFVRVKKAIDPAGNEYIYNYDGTTGGCIYPNNTSSNPQCNANNLTSIIYPDGAVRYYYYNELANINDGNLCSGEASSGLGLGNLPNALTGITDENGKRFSDWTYDCQGRATSSQHAGGAARVEIAYQDSDENGVKISTIREFSGSIENPSISTHLLTAKIIGGRSKNIASDTACVSCGTASQRVYDFNGNISSFVSRSGVITNFEFDLQRNLEISRTEAFGTNQQNKITTEWHEKYNLPTKILSPSKITSFLYDQTGNLIMRSEQATLDKTGESNLPLTLVGKPRVWTYTYNKLGQVTSLDGPRNDLIDRTTFLYDEMGNIKSRSNALGHTTEYSNYDLNGRVGKIKMPNGSLVLMDYSNRGKLLVETLYNNEKIEVTRYDYDSAGQLKSVALPDGTAYFMVYDDAHRLIAINDGLGNSTEYVLDIQGNRVREQVKDPDGVVFKSISRKFDRMNQLEMSVGE